MSWRQGSWLLLVFCLTLLVELPAAWVVRALGLPAEQVSGSLWHGEARRLGMAGPLHWDWRPWRAEAIARFGFQGQGWQAQATGWPWAWQVELQALQPQRTVEANYRIVGQWQGSIRLRGANRRCQAAQGRLEVTDLALSAPWSLALGQGHVQMDCRQGWRLLGHLNLAGQHQASLDADLPGRRAQLRVEVQKDAAIAPVLRGARWLDEGRASLDRRLSW
ncbi:general secretion pathway protein GspN [Pseudomonas fulva]|nr:general secretion pathway protein GspN [Pseudomonas fulva]MBF8779864.1 general secretion pathway protein GspN [Pseudomonas fulva]